MDLNTLMTLRNPVYEPLYQNQIENFSTESIARWLSNRKVRENILNICVTITDLDIDRNNIDNVKFFDSPHFNEYIDYINDTVIPSYLVYLRRERPRSNLLIEKVLYYLLSASIGHMSILPDSAGHILGDLFPHVRLVKEPAEGNCYFCSVGHNVNADNIEMRNAIANEIIQSGNVASLAREYIRGCKQGKFVDKYIRDPSEFISQFTELLRQPCRRGQKDCNECIWGSNEYDSYVANHYNRPLVSISIDRNSIPSSLDLNSRFNSEDARLIRRYLGITDIAPFRFVRDQRFILGISYVFPSYVYEMYPNIRDAFFTDMGVPIGYMYRGDHFNAITFI